MSSGWQMAGFRFTNVKDFILPHIKKANYMGVDMWWGNIDNWLLELDFHSYICDARFGEDPSSHIN